jgi:NAD(P)H-quinone oxidoreductase subunit 4L
MNSLATATTHKNNIAWLVAYAVVAVGLVLWYSLGLLPADVMPDLQKIGPSLLPENVRSWSDALVFGIIGMLGVLALQFGASTAGTLTIGTWGAFMVLSMGQNPLIRYLTFAAVLFAIGMYGMVCSRNAVRVLMSIELMLNAVNINFVAFARYVDPGNIKGQVFAIFILTVAAAEAAVGLAIVLAVYRNMATVDMERFNLLKW